MVGAESGANNLLILGNKVGAIRQPAEVFTADRAGPHPDPVVVRSGRCA